MENLPPDQLHLFLLSLQLPRTQQPQPQQQQQQQQLSGLPQRGRGPKFLTPSIVDLLLQIITQCAETCRKQQQPQQQQQQRKISAFHPQLAGKTISLALEPINQLLFTWLSRGTEPRFLLPSSSSSSSPSSSWNPLSYLLPSLFSSSLPASSAFPLLTSSSLSFTSHEQASYSTTLHKLSQQIQLLLFSPPPSTPLPLSLFLLFLSLYTSLPSLLPSLLSPKQDKSKGEKGGKRGGGEVRMAKKSLYKMMNKKPSLFLGLVGRLKEMGLGLGLLVEGAESAGGEIGRVVGLVVGLFAASPSSSSTSSSSPSSPSSSPTLPPLPIRIDKYLLLIQLFQKATFRKFSSPLPPTSPSPFSPSSPPSLWLKEVLHTLSSLSLPSSPPLLRTLSCACMGGIATGLSLSLSLSPPPPPGKEEERKKEQQNLIDNILSLYLRTFSSLISSPPPSPDPFHELLALSFSITNHLFSPPPPSSSFPPLPPSPFFQSWEKLIFSEKEFAEIKFPEWVYGRFLNVIFGRLLDVNEDFGDGIWEDIGVGKGGKGIEEKEKRDKKEKRERELFLRMYMRSYQIREFFGEGGKGEGGWEGRWWGGWGGGVGCVLSLIRWVGCSSSSSPFDVGVVREMVGSMGGLGGRLQGVLKKEGLLINLFDFPPNALAMIEEQEKEGEQEEEKREDSKEKGKENAQENSEKKEQKQQEQQLKEKKKIKIILSMKPSKRKIKTVVKEATSLALCLISDTITDLLWKFDNVLGEFMWGPDKLPTYTHPLPLQHQQGEFGALFLEILSYFVLFRKHKAHRLLVQRIMDMLGASRVSRSYFYRTLPNLGDLGYRGRLGEEGKGEVLPTFSFSPFPSSSSSSSPFGVGKGVESVSGKEIENGFGDDIFLSRTSFLLLELRGLVMKGGDRLMGREREGGEEGAMGREEVERVVVPLVFPLLGVGHGGLSVVIHAIFSSILSLPLEGKEPKFIEEVLPPTTPKQPTIEQEKEKDQQQQQQQQQLPKKPLLPPLPLPPSSLPFPLSLAPPYLDSTFSHFTPQTPLYLSLPALLSSPSLTKYTITSLSHYTLLAAASSSSSSSPLPPPPPSPTSPPPPPTSFQSLLLLYFSSLNHIDHPLLPWLFQNIEEFFDLLESSPLHPHHHHHHQQQQQQQQQQQLEEQIEQESSPLAIKCVQEALVSLGGVVAGEHDYTRHHYIFEWYLEMARAHRIGSKL